MVKFKKCKIVVLRLGPPVIVVETYTVLHLLCASRSLFGIFDIVENAGEGSCGDTDIDLDVDFS
jgi:hypothetical protein